MAKKSMFGGNGEMNTGIFIFFMIGILCAISGGIEYYNNRRKKYALSRENDETHYICLILSIMAFIFAGALWVEIRINKYF